jgi:hypothetical protein
VPVQALGPPKLKTSIQVLVLQWLEQLTLEFTYTDSERQLQATLARQLSTKLSDGPRQRRHSH